MSIVVKTIRNHLDFETRFVSRSQNFQIRAGATASKRRTSKSLETAGWNK